jgi:hypothetical protein
VFSAARSARLAKNALRNTKIIRKMSIASPPSLVARPESYGVSLFLARIVSHAKSRRTEYSNATANGDKILGSKAFLAFFIGFAVVSLL